MSKTSTETTTTERRRIKELEAMVAEVIQETPDTTTLVLFTGNERLDYEAGHFLTVDPHQFEGLERFTAFLEDLKGKKEPPRAYSMSSAPHERWLSQVATASATRRCPSAAQCMLRAWYAQVPPRSTSRRS